MSKIYEALRRHEKRLTPIASMPIDSRQPLMRALESVSSLLHRLAREARHGLVLHFVAATHGEGASTISSEFACVASKVLDSRILLIDADNNEYASAARFGAPTMNGILDNAQDGPKPAEARISLPEWPQLQVDVLCGPDAVRPSRKALPLVYEKLRKEYDLIIVDCPAIFSDRYFDLCPDAADGVVLIVEAERNRPEIIRQAQSLVENAGGKLIGAILNRRNNYIPDWLYRLL